MWKSTSSIAYGIESIKVWTQFFLKRILIHATHFISAKKIKHIYEVIVYDQVIDLLYFQKKIKLYVLSRMIQKERNFII